MKVTLEKGETLDVALVEGDRIVGTLSLELRGTGLGVRAASESPRRTESAASEAPAQRSSSGGGRGGSRKRNISTEARAKMAEAQKRRWEKYRQQKGK